MPEVSSMPSTASAGSPAAYSIFHDPQLLSLGGGVFGLLVVASLVGWVLSRALTSPGAVKTVKNLNARTRAWWFMAILFGGALLAGRVTTIVLFAVLSFLSLREFVTLAPTRRGDHRTLFWAFFVAVPAQYLLVDLDWYGLFSILLPVYGLLFFAVRTATAGDVTRYLERTAKVSLAVMFAVYFLSHVPALLLLRIPDYGGQNWKLIVYLVAVAQLSDVFQYVWGKLTGRTKVAPKLSPNKTVEGLVGGVATACCVGMLMTPLTPFGVWQSGLLSLAIALWGFFGGLVMSGIKRDAGVKDFSQIIEGHGGITDRIDSLIFAAPVFFHLVRYFFEPGM